MKTIPVKTYYLEITSPPKLTVEQRENIVILKTENPSIAYYKFLYSSVGNDLMWVDRLMMSEKDLFEIIRHPKINIYVLFYRGMPAGYVELDGRIENEIEVAYFGIIPEFRGMKLGKFFLEFAIAKAFSSPISRLWLHTCELDHPSAMHVYTSAGFKLYDEKIIEQKIPS